MMTRPVTVHGVSSGVKARGGGTGNRERFRTAVGADERTRPADIAAGAGGNYI